jgi:hypothetical protein
MLIPIGTYDIVSICTVLVSLITATFPGGVACVISPTTKRLTITHTTTQFIIDFNNSTCNELLGFPLSGLSYASPNIVQLQGMEYINIRSIELVPVLHSLSLNERSNNILDCVAINADFGGSISFSNVEGHHSITHHHPVIIKQFDIVMTDKVGNPVDFNGSNYKLTLKITYVD